jgi:ketosteroid isomerase-like protein
MIRSWLAKKIVTRSLDALNRGDLRPTLRMDGRDVHFRFPGTSSWATDITGRDQVEAWLRRMVATGLQHSVDEVVAGGPPWRMTMVLRGTDSATAADGTVVYENRYVIWGRSRWGLLQDYEVYEDTEKALAWDAHLAANSTGAVTSSRSGFAENVRLTKVLRLPERSG